MLTLSPIAQRVLGCLVEKALATPQQYPLTLNSLRTACNQTTGRDPVVDYDDNTVEQGLTALREHKLVRTEVVKGSRTPKYSHRLVEELELDRRDQAVLSLLLLRGAQTEGELNSRSGRLHEFSSLEEVDETLASLAGRGYVERLERRPGEKAQRWRHLLGPGAAGDVAARATETATTTASTEHDASRPPVHVERTDEFAALRDRVEALEREVAELRRTLGRRDDAAPATSDDPSVQPHATSTRPDDGGW